MTKYVLNPLCTSDFVIVITLIKIFSLVAARNPAERTKGQQ